MIYKQRINIHRKRTKQFYNSCAPLALRSGVVHRRGVGFSCSCCGAEEGERESGLDSLRTPELASNGAMFLLHETPDFSD